MPGILGIFDGILGIIGRFLEILAVFWIRAELPWLLQFATASLGMKSAQLGIFRA
jgi:hypothetical protein